MARSLFSYGSGVVEHDEMMDLIMPSGMPARFSDAPPDSCSSRISAADIAYICHTYYHVYVAALKAHALSQKADIIIVDTIPNVSALSSSIASSGIFQSVGVVARGFSCTGQKSYLLGTVWAKTHKKILHDRYGLLRKYDHICMFNDITEMGALLAALKVHYHLLEDGLDCYSVFDQNVPRRHPFIKKLLWRTIGLPYALASSSYCKLVEVNSMQDVHTFFSAPVIEVPRRPLIEGDEGWPKLVLSVFNCPDLKHSEGGVLILTTSTLDPSDFGPYESAVEVIERVVDLFADESCYIKPHPFDVVDYGVLSSKATVLNKDFPIEVLEFIEGMRFDTVVGFGSTSLAGIRFADKRYSCGLMDGVDGVEHLSIEDRNVCI
ncbi:MAG TPA: alpha-2,8-polysialyltransferase family protein [Candidatus Rubneribacter avistercoris]|nr:alpha-2,8-polysialyltransferase family protein [Candidatus Rubneribacter avistercoris]